MASPIQLSLPKLPPLIPTRPEWATPDMSAATIQDLRRHPEWRRAKPYLVPLSAPSVAPPNLPQYDPASGAVLARPPMEYDPIAHMPINNPNDQYLNFIIDRAGYRGIPEGKDPFAAIGPSQAIPAFIGGKRYDPIAMTRPDGSTYYSYGDEYNKLRSNAGAAGIAAGLNGASAAVPPPQAAPAVQANPWFQAPWDPSTQRKELPYYMKGFTYGRG